jgi:hypothetical protein
MTIGKASQLQVAGALSTDYILITGAQNPGSKRSRNMDFELPHAHASNAAEELEGLQATDFWLELPPDARLALSRAHGILIGLTSAMEAADLV